MTPSIRSPGEDRDGRSRGPARAAVGVAIACLLAATGPAVAQEEGGTLPPGLEEELARRAEAILAEHHIPGMAVAVVRADELLYAGGFGLADRESGAEVEPATLFQIGSITKPLTAAVAGILADRGAVSWEDRAAPYLWEPPAMPDSAITLRQLATHTAGLPGDPPTLRRRHDDYPVLAFTHVELYRSLRETELSFPAGTDWSYSNYGYALLGHVLERAADGPYETLLAEELLTPLGMAATTVTLWPELRGRLATPYYFDEAAGALIRYTPWDEEALAPAGGVSSTVEDLARFVSFLFRARAGAEPRLRAGTARLLTSSQRRLSESAGYGMGWFVAEREGLGPVAYHGGGVDGYSGWVELALEREVAVIVLVNSGEGGPIVDLARWALERVARSGRAP